MFHHQSSRHQHLEDSIMSFVMKFLKMRMEEKFGFMTQNPDTPKISFLINITLQHWIAKMVKWRTFGSLVLEIWWVIWEQELLFSQSYHFYNMSLWQKVFQKWNQHIKWIRHRWVFKLLSWTGFVIWYQNVSTMNPAFWKIFFRNFLDGDSRISLIHLSLVLFPWRQSYLVQQWWSQLERQCWQHGWLLVSYMLQFFSCQISLFIFLLHLLLVLL